MSAIQPEWFIGHEWETDRRSRGGLVLGVVKCGGLCLVSQFGAGHVIHSSSSLSTPHRPSGSTTFGPELGDAGFERGQTLSGLTYPPLPTD
jgi:hypothetical protein